MTPKYARLLKQVELLRAFVVSLENAEKDSCSECAGCNHAYEAQQVMEQVRKLEKKQEGE